MRKITLQLTDDEYAALEIRADQERRSVRQMAERLVTAPPVFQVIPNGGYQWWLPTISAPFSSPNQCSGTNDSLRAALSTTTYNGDPGVNTGTALHLLPKASGGA